MIDGPRGQWTAFLPARPTNKLASNENSARSARATSFFFFFSRDSEIAVTLEIFCFPHWQHLRWSTFGFKDFSVTKRWPSYLLLPFIALIPWAFSWEEAQKNVFKTPFWKIQDDKRHRKCLCIICVCVCLSAMFRPDHPARTSQRYQRGRIRFCKTQLANDEPKVTFISKADLQQTVSETDFKERISQVHVLLTRWIIHTDMHCRKSFPPM